MYSWFCRRGEMVDTHVSGACGAIRGGSSPPVDKFLVLHKVPNGVVLYKTFNGGLEHGKSAFANKFAMPLSTDF